jgi:hypothetical protein
MNKKTIIDKILNESIDDKINELTSRLEEKINILEVDAYDLEYEQTYVFDSVNGKPKRVIFKGRGIKGRSDSETQTYHFEDDRGNDIMLSKKGVLNKIKNVDKEMKKENDEFTEGNAFTKKLKDTKKGGEFKIGNKTYVDKSELEEKLYGGQKKLDKNNNNKIDSEDFKMLRKHNKSEIEELGGMDDVNPRFGKKNFGKMSYDEIMGLLTQKLEDDEDESGTKTNNSDRLEEAKKFIQKAVNKMGKKGTSGKFASWCKKNDLASEDGEVTQKCINKAMKSDDSKVVKMANFAKNIGGFKGAKHESIMYKLALTENTTMDLTEDELIDMIEELVIEAKENEKFSGKAKGTVEYERISKLNKKENSDALKDVDKKMREYLKDGSKGQYNTNPKFFTKNNGELAKMDKKAYIPSDAVKDYVDNLTAAALENIDYDGINPDEKWVTDNIEGSSRTGNNPGWANTGESDVNKKRNKIRKDNLLSKIKRKAYNKSAQPIVKDSSGEQTDKASKLMMKLESTFEKEQNNLISEEFSKIMNLMSYNKKTQ